MVLVTDYHSNNPWNRVNQQLRINMTRRKHSEETKRKISEAHKHVDKTIQIETLRKLRDNPTHENWKRSHSKRFKGRWNITDGEHNKLLPESDAKEFLRNNPNWYRGLDHKRKQIMIENNLTGRTYKGLVDNNGVKSSQKELAILRILRKYQGEVIHNYLIPNSNYAHPYDYYIPSLNLLIEFDGKYWHRNDDPNYDQRAIIARDRHYNYLIIHEDDYDNAESKHTLINEMIKSTIS